MQNNYEKENPDKKIIIKNESKLINSENRVFS